MEKFKESDSKKFDVVSVRCNTKSDGINNAWIVLCDGVEYQTNKVVIDGKCISTTDVVEDCMREHHLTIKNASVDYSIDYTLIRNTKKFLVIDILKTITYRILGTSVTFGIGFISTGNLNVAVALGFSDLILKPLVYFIHERLWHIAKNQ